MRCLKKLFGEPDRPNKNESLNHQLWYPDAQVLTNKLRKRGTYKNGYPIGAVVHFTAGRSENGDKDAINAINLADRNGYSYMAIASNGNVFQAAPLNEWGYHAGRSYHDELGSGVSKHLVGIEVCCAGMLDENATSWFGVMYGDDYVRRIPHQIANQREGLFHKFTEAQEQSLIELLLWLKGNNPDIFDFDYVLGHDEVAPQRKNDPGGSLSMTMPMLRSYLKAHYE